MSKKNSFENQDKRVEYDNVIYLINSEENIAGVFGIGESHEIIIPGSINHESKEYYLTNILENAFKFSKIKSIRFSSDSKLQTIDKNAFHNSTIKSIRIPSSVISIGEGAFSDCYNLQVIGIPDDSKLQTIGKNAFHNTAFGSIRIPSSVTSIGEGAFSLCNFLKVIEIPDDSKLQTIDKNAFHITAIGSIRIPSSVISIGEGAFSLCNHLEVIEIPDDSKLQTIDLNAFFETAISSIKIPSELIDFKDGWCIGTDYLTKISVSPKNPRYCFFDNKIIIGKTKIEQSNYDCLVFCVRNIRQIKIPNFIEHICSCSFDRCEQLENVEFSDDSKLQTIGENAFSFSIIKSIRIPSSVTSICEGAFSLCEQLEVVEIPDDSKLQTIDKYAFSESKIESIKIPSELIDLKEGWCIGTKSLTKISVSPKNPRYFCYENKMIIGKTKIEQSNYDCLVFCVRNIRQIKIPNFIEHICSCSFDYCEQLENVEFSDDSKLQTIGENAFSFSTITSIQIPSSVTSVGEGAFTDCEQLCIIEAGNSKIISMYQTAFLDCTNALLLMIPAHS